MSTPFMGLNLPSPLVTLGPTWASMLNAALGQVDSHDHTNGQGVPITPAALDINDDLDFQGHAALNVQAVNLATLAAALAAPSQLQSVNGDLVWVNANGAQVPITSGNSIVGSPGNIQNLVAPASAQYVAGTLAFQWLSSAGVVAGLDASRLDLRQNSSATGPVVTIRAATSGVSTHTLIVPPTTPLGLGGALVGRTSGPNVSMGYAYLDNATLEEALVGGNYTWRIKNGGVAGTYSGSTPTAQVAYRGLTTEALAELAVTTAKLNGFAVTDAKIAPGAVIESKIGTGAVTETKIGNNEVTALKIAFGAVSATYSGSTPTAQVAYRGLSTEALAELAVTTAKLADSPNGVSTGKINNGAVTPIKMTSVWTTDNNGFTASNASLNATSGAPYVIFNTAQLAVPAEKLVFISMQGKSDGTESEFYFRNTSTTNDYNVFVRVKILGFPTFMRTFIYKTKLSANSGWQTVSKPECLVDRASANTLASVEVDVYTDAPINVIRFYLQNLTLFYGM